MHVHTPQHDFVKRGVVTRSQKKAGILTIFYFLGTDYMGILFLWEFTEDLPAFCMYIYTKNDSLNWRHSGIYSGGWILEILNR